MSDKTKIEWTDSTWNPITGCSVISAGCKNCYAMKLAGTRLQHHPSRAGLTHDTKAGPVWTGEVRLNHQWLDQPIRWSKQRLVFPCAHSDLFHDSVPDEWIDTIFGIMWACLYGRNDKPGHIFQVLTKRAARMRNYFRTDRREAWARAAVNHGGGTDPDGIWDQVMDFNGPHPRIWLGVSVEDQAAADERIPLLLDTPAAVRWISAEPLLGRIDLHHLNDGKEVDEIDCLKPWTLEQEIDSWRGTSETWEEDFSDWYGGIDVDASGDMHNKLDWVVVGGESGPKARPMHPQWARDLRDQCSASGVPFYFKQWGHWAPRSACYHHLTNGQSAADMDPGSTRWPCVRLTAAGNNGRDIANAPDGDDCYMQKVGGKLAGRMLDGVLHDAYPEVR